MRGGESAAQLDWRLRPARPLPAAGRNPTTGSAGVGPVSICRWIRPPRSANYALTLVDRRTGWRSPATSGAVIARRR